MKLKIPMLLTISRFSSTMGTVTPDFVPNTLGLYEPRRQKTGLRGFRPGPTQTGLYSHWRWLETWNFAFRKQRDCAIQVAKTKALISFAVTAKLICVFVFAYAKIRFSHVAAHIYIAFKKNNMENTVDIHEFLNGRSITIWEGEVIFKTFVHSMKYPSECRHVILWH